MEKRKLSRMLMRKCIWSVSFIAFLVLAAVFFILAITTFTRAPGNPVYFSQSAPGDYSRLHISDLSDPFASGSGETFYFAMDGQGYLYITMLSEKQASDLRERLSTSSDGATLSGTAVLTPDDVRRIACSCFPEISLTSFEDYFGPLYLDCVRSPFQLENSIWSAVTLGCILAAIFSFLLWLYRRITVSGCLERLERLGLTSVAVKELKDLTPSEYLGSVAITRHFILNLKRGFLYARTDLHKPRLIKHSRSLSYRASVFSGTTRTLVSVPFVQKEALISAFDKPATAQEPLLPGSFEEPAYWHMDYLAH